jgi:secreted trypsin-like serine protease
MSRRFGVRDRFNTALAVRNLSPDEPFAERLRSTVNAFRDPGRVLFQPAIVGGTDTLAHEFPTVGVLQRNGVLHGTGTLIGARTVLTAAHCVHGFDPFTLTFQLGLTIGAQAPLPAVASDFANLPGLTYNPSTFEHDVGLLFLATDPLPGTPRLALANGTEPIAIGDPVQKVGYGFTTFGAVGGGRQRKVTVSVSAVTGLRFHHGTAGSSVCFSDSGGPGLIGATIVGVTSLTFSCASGLDTRLVSAYLDWIRPRIQ